MYNEETFDLLFKECFNASEYEITKKEFDVFDNKNIRTFFTSGEKSRLFIRETINKITNKVKIEFSCTAFDVDCFNTRRFKEKLDELSSNSPNERFNFLVITKNGLEIVSRSGTCKSRPLKEENYNDDIVKEHKEIIEQWSTKESDGRLVILTGEPGTGKTYFIRTLQNKLNDYDFISVPSRMANNLGDPSFISALDGMVGQKGKILVLEDCDQLLMKRDGQNNELVAELLNLTDGIFASTFDIRVIITTNTNHKNFDDAITRNGRLYKQIEFKPLTEDKAKEFLLKNNCKHEVPENRTLANMFALLKGKNVKEKKVKKIGF